VSLLVASALLAAFKWTSNQRAIAETKRQILASLFELRLFQDDPRLMLRAIAGLLRQQARYLGYALVPLLVAAPLLVLLLPHLQSYYGYASLRPGESTLVIARLKASSTDTAPPPLTLDVSPGLHVDTPCVWASSLREGAWRISVERDGDHTIRVNGIAMPVRVTTAMVPHVPVLRPPDSPFEQITVIHPARTIDVAGLALWWPVVLFVLTTLFMLLGRPLFRVTF